MQIPMAFGRRGRIVEVPDANVAAVLTMPEVPPLPNPDGAVAAALRQPIGVPPLAELARGRGDAVIVICDITRPVPNPVLLPPILETLVGSGIARERISILVATGLHRPTEGDELAEMLGPDLATDVRVVNHRAAERSEQVPVGRTTGGVEAAVDAVYARAALKITVGFIEPHLMAGFSGGRKLCGIGCGSEGTIRQLHAPRIIEHPNSIEGRLHGNLLHCELTEIAALAGMDFTVNVTMDESHAITGVFAGHFDRAFRNGCEFASHSVSRTVDREVDIVVASCGGYPLDISYYQSAKAFTGARHICKPGGTIIVLSECREGLGKPSYVDLCRGIESMDSFLDAYVRCGGDAYDCARRNDQWQIHNMTRAMRKCECVLVDGGLSDDQRSLLLHQATPSFKEALSAALARHGPSAQVAVIPKGPNVLAQVR